MTISSFTDPETGRRFYSGLSSDTKPPSLPGAFFWETDTGDKYECYGGSNWFRTTNYGLSHVETINRSHVKVHQGLLWTASRLTNVTSLATFDVLIQVPAGTDMHMSVSVRAGAEMDFQGFSGTTFSAAGTAMTVINNNFNYATSPNTTVTYAPTVTTTGTEGYSDYLPGGAGGNAVGGQVGTPGGGAEFILKGGTDFLARLTNNTVQTVRASIVIIFYEVSV